MSLRRLPMCANIVNENHDEYRLLDLGCRTMALKPLLKGCKEYYGTDFVADVGVIPCDLEDGLTGFEDSSFDVVVALDVLEHLENAHLLLQEALRVTKRRLIVSLPNMYYLKFRWNFLLGNGVSGKYSFPPSPIRDRHRWLLSYREAEEFILENCKNLEVSTFAIVPERGRTKYLVEPVQNYLASKWPNAFAYGVLFR